MGSQVTDEQHATRLAGPRERLQRRLHSPDAAVLVPIVFSIATLVWLVLLYRGWGFDDPYVTYRYAGNLLAGKGLVYADGEQALSTVAPLYALLLAVLGLAWPDVPQVSNLIGLLSIVASALLLIKWKPLHQEPGGLIAGLLLSIWPLFAQTTGLERTLFMLLVLGGLYLVERSSYPTAAVVLAMAGILRPEGLLLGLVVALSVVIRRQPVPWKAMFLYVVPIALWYTALWVYYGSPLPMNLAAKQQQARMQMGTDFFAGFLQLARQYGRHPLYWLHAGLALVGLVRVVTRARHWVLLLAWTALYFLGYSLLGVSRYFWFYAPLVPAFVVLVAEGAVALSAGMRRLRLPRPVASGLAGLLVVCLVAPPLTGALTNAWRDDPRLQVYRDVGDWLREQTPSTATVGTLEVGIIGYYSQRPMIDFSGLVTPEVAERLASLGTYEASAAWAIEHWAPDYVVLDRINFAKLAGAPWFQATYAEVYDSADRRTLWMTVYERAGDR